MIKREVFFGFFVGVLANLLGIFLYIILFSEIGIIQTLTEAIENEFLGTLIAAGAVLNFLPFFYFLKKNRPYRARGVLMASILAALCIAILKIL